MMNPINPKVILLVLLLHKCDRGFVIAAGVSAEPSRTSTILVEFDMQKWPFKERPYVVPMFSDPNGLVIKVCPDCAADGPQPLIGHA